MIIGLKIVSIKTTRGVNMKEIKEIKEFNIRISLYNDVSKQAFKLFLFSITSLLDAKIIAKALKQYHKADYANIEIIN